MRILIVEDNASLAEALQQALSDQFYVVDLVFDGESAWIQTQLLHYDAIVLDVMLPNLDGIDLCKRLRTHGNNTPILMLTASHTTTDKVRGLDAGADEYVVKPIELAELLARVRALLRRGSSTSLPILDWEKLRLDPSSHEVTYNNQPLNLTPKEYSLLELFLRNPTRVLSRSFIIDSLWDFEYPPGEDTVKVHIKSLRRKLKTVQAPDDLIETIYGVGYRLKPL